MAVLHRNLMSSFEESKIDGDVIRVRRDVNTLAFSGNI
jgi:hypothetical protein